MNKKQISISLLIFLSIIFYNCNDRNIYFITTDHTGYADEIFKIPGDGKIKILSISGECNEVNKGGKYYWTHYQFSLETYTIILDCACDKFQPSDYFVVKKDDRLRLIIQHGEINTKYKVQYDFVEK